MNNSCIAFIGQVEDEEYWLQTLSKSLSGYGTINILTELEIEKLRLLPCQVQLVIVDSGSVTNMLEVVSQIRNEIPHSKILVVTASPLWKEVRQVIYAGADDYCQKTLDMDGILEHVERLIGKYPKGGRNQ